MLRIAVSVLEKQQMQIALLYEQGAGENSY